MSWSSDTLDNAAAITAGMPCILVGKDLSATATWIDTDSASPTNVTFSDYPLFRAFDGSLVTKTRASDNGSTYSYIQITDAGIDVDYIMLAGQWGTATVQIASDFSTSSNVKTLATIGGLSGEYYRKAVFFSKKYTSVPQIRVRCEGHFYVTQLVVGTRYQLSSRFQVPMDDKPLQSEDARSQHKSRHISVYETNRGRAEFECAYTLRSTAGGTYSINDVDTWRGIYSDTYSGTRPCGLVLDPTLGTGSPVTAIHWGYLGPGLQLPSEGVVRKLQFKFSEEPPYLERIP